MAPRRTTSFSAAKSGEPGSERAGEPDPAIDAWPGGIAKGMQPCIKPNIAGPSTRPTGVKMAAKEQSECQVRLARFLAGIARDVTRRNTQSTSRDAPGFTTRESSGFSFWFAVALTEAVGSKRLLCCAGADPGDFG